MLEVILCKCSTFFFFIMDVFGSYNFCCVGYGVRKYVKMLVAVLFFAFFVAIFHFFIEEDAGVLQQANREVRN